MDKRRHFTDDTAQSCWICAPGQPCKAHDPRMRKYLALTGDDAYYEPGEEPEQLAWSIDDEPSS